MKKVLLLIATLALAASAAFGQANVIPIVTVSQLTVPQQSQLNKAIVLDSADGTCLTGGGAGVVVCQWNGSAWVVIGNSVLYGKLATTAANNCSSSASPAVCAAATAGSVAVASAGTSLVVNTTAVTANSQIFIVQDNSLGTKLGITCAATVTAPYISARTAATSFTVTSSAPSGNPGCMSFLVVN